MSERTEQVTFTSTAGGPRETVRLGGDGPPPTDAERILRGLDDIASQVEHGRYEIRDTITGAALLLALAILLHGCMS